MTVRENLSFAAVERVSRYWIVDVKAEEAAIEEMANLLKIRSDGIDGPVSALSGGNQQKVVIGKWLMTKPRIILLNDPTRGIDVGTKQEIYQLLQRLAADGAAIGFWSCMEARLFARFRVANSMKPIYSPQPSICRPAPARQICKNMLGKWRHEHTSGGDPNRSTAKPNWG